MSFFTKIFLISLMLLISCCGRKSPIVPPDNFHIIDFDEDKK